MKSKHLIIYTEEESAKFFLNELLVRIRQDYRLFEWKFSVIAANGKYDQYARLKEKLSGFANNQGFLIVLRDQDEDACLKIKQRYLEKVSSIWKAPAKIRFLCHELETCYFADPIAASNILGITIPVIPDCDSIHNPAQKLQDHLDARKFKKTTYAKQLGGCIDYKVTTSKSFSLLMHTIFTFLGISA